MLDPGIGIQLTVRGWDAESIQLEHRTLIGRDDDAVLAQATALLRVLVTDNARDFAALHTGGLGQGRSQAGVLIVSSRQYPRSKKTIGLWVDGLYALLRDPPSQSLDDRCAWLPLPEVSGGAQR